MSRAETAAAAQTEEVEFEHGVKGDRARQAHELRVAGLSWWEVAAQTGYVDGKVASMAVTAYLQRAAMEHGEHSRHRALELELERLDKLHAAYWTAALAGDIPSANVVLKTSAARTRLLGLEQLDDSSERPRTIVISGNTEEYVAGLKAIVEGTTG